MTRPDERRFLSTGIWQLYLGLTLVALAVLVGLLRWWGVAEEDTAAPTGTSAQTRTAEPSDPSSTDPGTDPSSTDPSSTDPSSPSSTDVGTTVSPNARDLTPSVVDWGGSGHQVVVLLRNDGDRTVRRAQVTLTARDDNGRVLATAGYGARSTCCTVVGLPPGEQFGVFLNLGADTPVREVADVDLRFDGLRYGAADAPLPEVEISDATLRRTDSDAVVEATLALTGSRAGLRDLNGYVAGQAFLVDRAGRPIGVISGRFYCFSAAEPRREVAMQLLRPVPAGTRIARVLAYPVAVDDGLPAPHTCPTTDGES